MLNITMGKDKLFVYGDLAEFVLNWEHRLFFITFLSFEADEVNSCFVLDIGKGDLLGTIDEIVNYMSEENLEYNVSDNIQILIDELNRQLKEYQDALEVTSQSFEANFIDLQLPRFKRTLKDYQIPCVDHLIKVKHGANFSVPGSGKTTMMYAAFDEMYAKGIAEKILVIGPISSFMPWEEEYEGCYGVKPKSARLTGTRTERQYIYNNSQNYNLFLCHYKTASNDLSSLIELCKKHKFFMIIDESHNIKKMDGVYSDSMILLAPYSSRRAILSGTPMPNDYRDLWTQFTFLWPRQQLLGDLEAYKYRCNDSEEKTKIQRELNPFFVRVKKSDLELPPPNFNIVKCELSQYQYSIYRALAVQFLAELDLQAYERQEMRKWRRARMIRLLQTASNPTLLSLHSDEFNIPPLNADGASVIQLINRYADYEIPSKINEAQKIVRQLVEKGENVLVWSSFVHNIIMLKNMLSDLHPLEIHGAIPKDDEDDEEFNREQQIREFKNSPYPRVLIANPAACAESISLHRVCHNAIYVDRTFNCGQYMQSLDRVHRIGTDRQVNYYILLATDTIDETVDRRLIDKQQAMIDLFEGDLPLGSLDTPQYEMEFSDNEANIDFEETVKDVREHWMLDSRNV